MIEAKAVEDSGDDVAGLDGTFRGEAPDGIAFSDDTSALHAATCEGDGEALGPVVTAAGGVDLGCAAKLAEAGDEGGVE